MANQDSNQDSATVQGTSSLYDFGTSPNTRAAVSQKVRIMAPSFGSGSGDSLKQIGVLSEFSPSISRDVTEIRGIGFGDKVAELVPGVTTAPTGSFTRSLLYLSNLWQATGYAGGVDGICRSLAHHRWPFDIEQQMVFSTLADKDLGVPNEGTDAENTRRIQFPSVSDAFPSAPGHSALITYYEACWFTDWSASFAADSGMIQESGSVMITDVHDARSDYGEFINTGNDPTLGQKGSIAYGGSINPVNVPLAPIAPV